MRKHLHGSLVMSLAMASIFAISAAGAEPSTPIKSKGLQAITKPSDERILSFSSAGRVASVPVQVGDDVKAGQLIASLDDKEAQAALATDKHKAEVTDPISMQAEVAVHAQKVLDVKRLEEAPPGSVGKSEVDAAKLEVTLASARIEIAKDLIVADTLKYEQTKLTVDKLKLYTPIEGVVAPAAVQNQVSIKEGEVADGSSAKVLRIVKVDPLWIEVPVPVLEARRLKKEDGAQVTFSDNKVLPGKVVLIFPVGDSASETIVVRVEVPNPEKLQPGENVFVKLSPAASVAVKP